MVGLAFTSWEDFLLPHNHNLPTRAKNSLFAAHSPNQPTGCSKFTFLIFSSATRREVPLLLLVLLILLLPSTHSLSEEPFALLLLLYSELHVNHPIPRDGDWIYFTLFFTLLSTDLCCCVHNTELSSIPLHFFFLYIYICSENWIQNLHASSPNKHKTKTRCTFKHSRTVSFGKTHKTPFFSVRQTLTRNSSLFSLNYLSFILIFSNLLFSPFCFFAHSSRVRLAVGC